MLKHFLVLKTVISFIIPYVILYAIYIQLNGEASPGGGFQAGVIFASSIIGFDLIGGKAAFGGAKTLIICAVLGVLLYASTGLVSFLSDDNYLNYDSINPQNATIGQHIGIFSIELGVGLTVASIMCLIYLSLREEGDV
jgi:multicomponent Na+:H+ antiporter subunit B